ncbi:hypothetical protein ACRAWF_42265 [Streptomyces sp. L7]
MIVVLAVVLSGPDSGPGCGRSGPTRRRRLQRHPGRPHPCPGTGPVRPHHGLRSRPRARLLRRR